MMVKIETDNKWREDVFSDADDIETRFRYLKEYVLTLRENIKETARDIDKILVEVKEIGKEIESQKKAREDCAHGVFSA